VWHRDANHCRAPGCRSARGLEIHHIARRADGGGHEPSNLILLCSACHHAHHDGLLAITGTATDLVVAVDTAIGRIGPTAPLEQVIVEALRACPRPTIR